jgi:hypothetical protein
MSDWRVTLPGCGPGGARGAVPVTPAAAASCLRGRHIVFLGDSLQRYQYVSLVRWLERGGGGEWVTEAPPGEVERAWAGGWTEYYTQTSARNGGRELCDCWRQLVNDAWASM